MNFITNLPKRIALILIKIYQKTLSTDHSFWANPQVFRVCIYSPSCSQYTYEAIDRFGIIRGGLMGTKRIISCNPLSKGGYDPVPEKKK